VTGPWEEAVFDEVRSAVDTLKEVAHDLDPLRVDGQGVADLFAVVTEGERVCRALVVLATEGPCKPVEVHVVADSALLARHTEPGERCEIRGIGPVPVTTPEHCSTTRE
jgi:hypothetical protein